MSLRNANHGARRMRLTTHRHHKLNRTPPPGSGRQAVIISLVTQRCGEHLRLAAANARKNDKQPRLSIRTCAGWPRRASGACFVKHLPARQREPLSPETCRRRGSALCEDGQPGHVSANGESRTGCVKKACGAACCVTGFYGNPVRDSTLCVAGLSWAPGGMFSLSQSGNGMAAGCVTPP